MKTKKDLIIIDGKEYGFDRISWTSGIEFMDKVIALEAMKVSISILSKYNVKPFLMWGTLLGAIREHGFIPHDTDVDMGIKVEDVNSLERAIPELYSNEFKICRYKKGYIYSFIYKGVICDFDVIRKAFFPYSLNFAFVLEQLFPKRFFLSLDKICFCGLDVYVPHNPESFLECRYGKDWRVPQKGTGHIIMPKWMILERFIYRVIRKFKYIRFKKFGYDDPDFF